MPTRPFAAVALLALCAAAAGQPKPDAAPPWQALKLPSGTVVLVSKDARELVGKLDAVVLSPDEYKKLTDQLDALTRKAAPEPARPPSICALHVRADAAGRQPVARVTAKFEFETARPGATVFLGCQRGQPSSGTLDDGRLPSLVSTEEGLSVIVDVPGRHALTLELETPIGPRDGRAGEVGFQLGLSGAPITRLTMDPLPGTPSVSLGVHRVDAVPRGEVPAVARLLDAQRVDAARLAPKAEREPLALGPADFLELSWEPPSPEPAPAETPLSAQTDVTVRLTPTEAVTVARMRLRGPAREWRVWAPISADFAVEGASPARPEATAQAPAVVRPIDPSKPPVWLVRPRDRAAEVVVTVQTRVPLGDPAGRKPIAVGPFVALDVPAQSGTIRAAGPPDMRLAFQAIGDTRREAAAGDEAAFRTGTPPVGPGGDPVPPLTIDARPIAGGVQTRVEHVLTLTDAGWRVASAIEVTPVRAEVDRLDLEVPPELRNPEASSEARDLVEGVGPAAGAPAGRRVLSIRLARPRRSAFRVLFEGLYPLPLSAQEASMRLPRVLNTDDRAGGVSARAPEGVDVRGSVSEWEGDRVAAWTYPLAPSADTGGPVARPPGSAGPGRPARLSATVRRSPAVVELAWRPLRAELSVDAVADVSLRERQAVVTHVARVGLGEPPPRVLRLKGPASVSGVRLLSGGRSLEPGGPGEWLIPAPEGSGREGSLTWSYAVPLPAAVSTTLALPLLWLEGATQAETRVRVWRDGGPAAALAPGTVWQEHPAEAAPERDALPALVASAAGTGVPLTLTLAAPEPGGAVARAWADRALVQARHGEGGTQDYRARLVLRRWLGPSLDIDLPAPPDLRSLEILWDGRRLEQWEAVPDADRAARGVRRVRVPLPAHRGRPASLELRYQVQAGRGDGPAERLTRWDVSFAPPEWPDSLLVGLTRWQASVPERWVPLLLSGGLSVEHRWQWANGVLTPVPGRTPAELESWLAGGVESPAVAEAPAAWEAGPATLVGRATRPGPLSVAAVPRLAWLLVCSLTTLLGGLLLVRLPRPVAWLCGVLLALAGGVLSVAYPEPALQVLFGVQPGAAALGLTLAARAASRRLSGRRRPAPSFSRSPPPSPPPPAPPPVLVPLPAAAGSPSSGRRGTRESTVDAPARPPEPWSTGSGQNAVTGA